MATERLLRTFPPWSEPPLKKRSLRDIAHADKLEQSQSSDQLLTPSIEDMNARVESWLAEATSSDKPLLHVVDNLDWPGNEELSYPQNHDVLQSADGNQGLGQSGTGTEKQPRLSRSLDRSRYHVSRSVGAPD